MSAHGTISLWMADHSFEYRTATKGKLRSGPLISTASDDRPSGFRHFLQPPDVSQRFTFKGEPFDPTVEAQKESADALMMKLADIMRAEPEAEFNPDIPSGYTYLLQLIAHDLVESSLFLSRSQSGVLGLSNVRTKPLRLETIFGGGPIVCPHAYDTNECGFRDRLRLGQVRPDNKPYTVNTGDFRDIARARATDMLDAPARPKYPEALIGDARNDSHAILSQLVVVFHHFQRKILANIEANQNILSTGSEIVDAQRNFVATQSACALIFRSIVRNDVLRRILHPDVRAAYEASPTKTADPPRDLNIGPWLVPLEFSFGFFRFGHSMIRSVYAFNSKTSEGIDRLKLPDILCHTSEESPDLMPFEDKWTIDWRRFFGNDETTNFSVMIGPWSRFDLENAVRGPENCEPGLMGRDLISSIATQPWSVRALAQALSKNVQRDLFRSSPYLAGDLNDPANPPWLAAVQRLAEPTPRQAEDTSGGR